MTPFFPIEKNLRSDSRVRLVSIVLLGSVVGLVATDGGASVDIATGFDALATDFVARNTIVHAVHFAKNETNH